MEKVFSWIKTVAGLRQTKLRGRRRVDWLFRLTAAAHNLVRMVKLSAGGAVRRPQCRQRRSPPKRRAEEGQAASAKQVAENHSTPKSEFFRNLFRRAVRSKLSRAPSGADW